MDGGIAVGKGGGAVDCKNVSSLSKLSSQMSRYSAIQLATCLSGAASSRHGLVCAARPREIRPARSRTFRCLEMDGWLMLKGAASSLTVASPVASRATMARRVGSARAAKAWLRVSGEVFICPFGYIAIKLY